MAGDKISYILSFVVFIVLIATPISITKFEIRNKYRVKKRLFDVKFMTLFEELNV